MDGFSQPANNTQQQGGSIRKNTTIDVQGGSPGRVSYQPKQAVAPKRGPRTKPVDGLTNMKTEVLAHQMQRPPNQSSLSGGGDHNPVTNPMAWVN